MVGDHPLPEVILGLLVEVAAEEDVHALRAVLRIGLLRDLVEFLLSAPVLPHQHDVLEAVNNHAIDYGLVYRSEYRTRNADLAGRLLVQMGASNRERHDRSQKRVTQLARDVNPLRRGSEGMSAKYGVRPALLDPPVYYEHCRLALLVDGVVNLWIRHQLDFDRRFLALRDRYSTRREHTCHHHDQCHHCPLHVLPLFYL